MVVNLFQFDKVPLVEAVCQWHGSCIPLLVSRLVAADQQDGIPPGVEGLQDPVGPRPWCCMRNSRMWA